MKEKGSIATLKLAKSLANETIENLNALNLGLSPKAVRELAIFNIRNLKSVLRPKEERLNAFNLAIEMIELREEMADAELELKEQFSDEFVNDFEDCEMFGIIFKAILDGMTPIDAVKLLIQSRRILLANKTVSDD